jgi:hypothetical protein
MEFAINFMKANAGIESPALLSSPFILITLGVYGHHRNYQITSDEARHLRHWTLLANAKGRYSRGSSETLLDQDLATLRQGGGAAEMLERLRLQVGRLDVTADELEGRNQRSALFKTMFLAFKAAGAKDWRSNLAISLDHSGAQHRLHFITSFLRLCSKLPTRAERLMISPIFLSSAARPIVRLATSHRRTTFLHSSPRLDKPPSKLNVFRQSPPYFTRKHTKIF